MRAPTNSVWLLGRILVDGPEEVDRVRILQARVLLETPDQRNERRILETRELMRQRTVAPAEPVADWPAPNPTDPFDLFEVDDAGAGREPVVGARPRGVREPGAAEAQARPQVRPARLQRGRAPRHPGRHRAGPRRDPRRRRPLRQDGRRLDLRRAPSRQFRRGLSLPRARGAHRPRARSSRPRRSISPATPIRRAGRCRAPTPIASPFRPTACRRRAPSGRSPCTR